MLWEQSRLMYLLAQDSRLREELVMNLIQAEENTPALTEWAQRLLTSISRVWRRW